MLRMELISSRFEGKSHVRNGKTSRKAKREVKLNRRRCFVASHGLTCCIMTMHLQTPSGSPEIDIIIQLISHVSRIKTENFSFHVSRRGVYLPRS